MLTQNQIQEDKDKYFLQEYRRTQDQRTLDKLCRRFEPVKWAAVEKVCQFRGVRDYNFKEDIAQYASLGVLCALKTYKDTGGSSLSSWVYEKAEGYARNALTQNGKVRVETFSDVFYTERAFNRVQAQLKKIESQEHYERLQRERKHAVIRKAIENLPEPHRTVTIQIYYKGRTQSAVAKDRQVSQPAIHYMLLKAFDMISTWIEVYSEESEFETDIERFFENVWFHRISNCKSSFW